MPSGWLDVGARGDARPLPPLRRSDPRPPGRAPRPARADGRRADGRHRPRPVPGLDPPREAARGGRPPRPAERRVHRVFAERGDDAGRCATHLESPRDQGRRRDPARRPRALRCAPARAEGGVAGRARWRDGAPLLPGADVGGDGARVRRPHAARRRPRRGCGRRHGRGAGRAAGAERHVSRSEREDARRRANAPRRPLARPLRPRRPARDPGGGPFLRPRAPLQRAHALQAPRPRSRGGPPRAPARRRPDARHARRARPRGRDGALRPPPPRVPAGAAPPAPRARRVRGRALRGHLAREAGAAFRGGDGVRAPPAMTRGETPMPAADTRAVLEDLFTRRILVLDGAMGTMIQRQGLGEADFRGERFRAHGHDLRGDNDVLALTRPDVVRSIHDAYLEAGADLIETNTFNATAIAQADYGLEAVVRELNVAAARLARAAADAWTARTPAKPRFVAGAIGPTNRTLSISPDVNDPTFRAVTFAALRTAYAEQVHGLLEGGVDVLLLETIFDTLNAKACLVAIEEVFEARGVRVPVMLSVTVTDRSGRTLSGQTVDAFYASVAHVRPLSVGINCALGAAEMAPYLAELAGAARCFVTCYPNAGLPNAFGQYDEAPETTARLLRG